MKCYNDIYSLCLQWVEKRMLKFTAQDLKSYFLIVHEMNVTSLQLGRIFQQLQSEDFIKFHGFSRSTDSKGKSCYTKVWLSAKYSRKQSENAKTNKNDLELNFDD